MKAKQELEKRIAELEKQAQDLLRRLSQLNETVTFTLWQNGHQDWIIEYHPASRHFKAFKWSIQGHAAAGRAGEAGATCEGIL